MRANQGAMLALSRPLTSCASAQWASVWSGVRKLLVQFTVVVPPTVRPWRIPIPASAVARAAPS